MTAPVAVPELLGATVTLPSGQALWAFPSVPRAPYRTGVQGPCEPCAKAGRTRKGVDRFASEGDDRLLCKSCWTAEKNRRAKVAREDLVFELWAGIGQAEAEAEEAARCEACGESEPNPECWLCAHAWLAEARAEYEQELAEVAEAAAAVEAERAAEAAARAAVEAYRFERIAVVSAAEDRVAALEAWICRCRDAVAAAEYGGSKARPVELLAELLARYADYRSSGRGRPSALAAVAWLQALDADWRSGRRSRPGRAFTAELAGCSERAVSSAWKLGTTLGWSTRITVGGPLSEQLRRATGRHADRAEFELVQLHRCEPTIRATWIPEALRVARTVLQRAEELLQAAQDELDAERVHDGGTGVDWAEQVRRLQLRRAVAKIMESVLAPDRLLMIELTISQSWPNIFPPPGGCRGEHFSSWPLMGWQFTPSIKIRSDRGRGAASGGGELIGASRSPTGSGCCDLDSGTCRGGDGCGSQYVEHPRTTNRAGRRSQRRRTAPPEWAEWAGVLTDELRRVWPWLAGSPRRWVAATVGAILGPDWTADAVVDLVRSRCGPPAADVHAPAAYLGTLLRQALSGPYAPAHPARAVDTARRAQAAEDAAAVREHAAVVRAESDARSAEAVPAAASTAAGTLAELRARLPHGRRRADRVAQLGGPGPETAPAAVEPEPWPATSQPGAGLPPGLAYR